MLSAVPGSQRRGRRKGIPVRAGSVREARIDASLSLAQVAGTKVTRVAIHLIEKGKSRPSLETLRHIARQTHKPIEYFLDGQDGLVELPEQERELRALQQLVAVRDFQAVVETAPALLGRRPTDDNLAWIRFYLGQAYCRLVRPREALEHLPQARAQFEQLGDELMAVETLDWESCAHGLIDDPSAISLANQALERCRGLDPKPAQVEARILGHIASMYVVAQSWAQSVSYYQAAVDAASDVKDLLQLAKLHHGLALAHQRMHEPANGRRHLDKALALYSIERDPSAVYRVENDLGYLLLEEGQLDSAEKHLHVALAGSEQLKMDRRGRGFILNNLGELNLRRGRIGEAASFARQALEAGDATEEGIVISGANVLLGRIDELQGNPREADRKFEVAIGVLEKLAMPDRLRDCHMTYAEMLEARPDIVGAARHWKRAAEIGRLASAGVKSNAATTPQLSRSKAAGRGASA